MSRPNFDASRVEMELILKIAERAERELEVNWQRSTAIMDLCAANNSCPLDLVAMLAGDRADFSHDIHGIRRHINRQTGVLEDCFLPRFAFANADAARAASF